MSGFLSALASPFKQLMNPEGRRAWALMLLAGGGLSMTIFAGFVLYLVANQPKLAFYLGIGALLLIGIVITGYAGLLVKRDIDLKALGVNLRISDQEKQDIADKVAAAVPTPVVAAPVAPAPTVVISNAPAPQPKPWEGPGPMPEGHDPK